MLYERLDNAEVHCHLCHHQCRISESKFGICGMRQNQDGTLYTHAYGEVIAANVDPIEKKPLYHFLPGTLSFSVATMGCNFRCGFCQNWQISQSSRRKGSDAAGLNLSPEDIVLQAADQGCRSIAYTYTEPTIFFEYAYDTAKLAKDKGPANVFVTNGFMTPEALRTINPYLDACNVDLKAFNDDFYRTVCHGSLQPVLDSIRTMKSLGIWVEVTTLVVPGSNDREDELREIACFLAGIDTNIPWHISRFHPDYEYSDSTATPIEALRTAYAIGKGENLRNVYIGNVPRETRDTQCPHCLQVLIRRTGYETHLNITDDGRCPQCNTEVAGVFEL